MQILKSKRSLWLSFSIILFLCCGTNVVDTLPNGLGEKLKNAARLKEVIDNNEPNYVIIDVRSDDAYKAGHIPTAINMPNGIISDMKKPPEKDKYIILYCDFGQTSKHVATEMIKDGYSYVLAWGGIEYWPYGLETSS